MKLPSKVTLRFEYDDGIILEDSFDVILMTAKQVRSVSGARTPDDVYGAWDDGSSAQPPITPRAVVANGLGKTFTLWVTAHELDHALHDLAFGLLLRRK